MKCSQCEKPAVVQLQGAKGELGLALCVDCDFKFQQSAAMRLGIIAAGYNLAAGNLERSLGIPVGRVVAPPVPISTGPVTLNNISIRGDLLGVLNTGSIQTVDNSVTAIRNAGDPELAKQVAGFVEAVAGSRELSDTQRREVLDLMSLVTSEVTAPAKQRRSAAMLTVLANISTIVGTVATIATKWGALKALLARAFTG